jgi:3-mercaptopyruvate sulfurtransferase SseA
VSRLPRNTRVVICISLVLAVLVGTSCAPAAAPTAVPTTEPAVSGPPTSPPTKVTPTTVAELPKSADQIQLIKPEDLKKLIDAGADIVVVDNQPAEVYAMGHIKGAVNLPFNMQIRSTGGLPMDKLLVLYCACAHEEDARDVAMQLITRFGYQKIMLLEGGWNRWVELGYPTEKGS